MKQPALPAWVDACISAQEAGGVGVDHPLWWAIGRFCDFLPEHPDACWRAILAILDRAPGDHVLSILGAGPLADLIHAHGPAFIDRIEFEAGESPRFKALLSRVW